MTGGTREKLLRQVARLAASSRIRLEAVLPGTEHPDPVVAAAYIRLLWERPCDATFARLMALSRRGNAVEVVVAAAHALGRYIWSGMQLDPYLDEEFGFAENVTPDQVDAARTRLHALVDDPGVPLEVRHEALRSLAFDPDDRLVEQVELLYRSERSEDVVLALECMGRAGLRRWHDHIVAQLEGADDDKLLEAAIHAAGDACLEAVEDRVVALTHDSRPGVALAATWALRNVSATSRGRNRLFELLEGEDRVLAAKAKEALIVLDGLEDGEAPVA